MSDQLEPAPTQTTEPTVRMPISLIEDLHARWHDEPGNMLGRSDCGWQGCTFYDAAEFALSQPTPSAVHFAPYGSTAASDGTPLPRSTRWNATTGEYQDGEPFTVKRDRTTCPDCRARFAAEPPSIADMAPGTTFTADKPQGHLVATGGEIVRRHGRRWMKCVFGADYELVNDMGEPSDADEIDASTIRDVTPPRAD